MLPLTSPAHYGDIIKTLEISQASGGGDVYQVTIDKYHHQGQMLKVNGQWVAYLNGPEITGDEVLILGEMIEEGFGDLP